jgi:hypothetical protein
MGLTDHVQVDMAPAEQNFGSVTHSSGLLVGVRRLNLIRPAPTTTEYLLKNAHTFSLRTTPKRAVAVFLPSVLLDTARQQVPNVHSSQDISVIESR